MTEPRLRPSVRAVILDEADRLLLCLFDLPVQGLRVWTAPGGGVEPGYDGVINDYYLIRTDHFVPHGSLGDAGLRAESITGFRWWGLEELHAYRGTALVAPPNLASLLEHLLEAGPPASPLDLGP